MRTDAPDGQHAPSAIAVGDLARLAESQRDNYLTAAPWPNLVIDDVFDPAVIAAAEAQEIQRALDLKIQVAHGIVKAESPEVSGQAANDILDALLSTQFVSFLEEVTGIASLIADPTHARAGLHVSPPGAYQALHRDFRRHPVNGLFHRVNVLVFLNSDWKEEYGGQLELWPEDTSACGRQILPLAGKLVIFETTPTSYHGIPEPIKCPPGRARLSLASYYYTETPGPNDRRDLKLFGPRRPQDPVSIDIGKFKDVPFRLGRLARDTLTHRRSDSN